jgi:tetratricopeptide (TPR) repeat protein
MANTSCLVNMRLTLVVIVVAVPECSGLLAQGGLSSSKSVEKLGTVSFPISCSSEVRPEFERGVALLHSFQYALAEASSEHVAAQDFQCAMAYWGQAMGLYHQLWNWPDEETLTKGQLLVQQAVKAEAKTTTDREIGYIKVPEDFYQSNPKLERAARIGAYSAKMADLCHRYPEDSEVVAFYALSRLAMDREGVDGARVETVTLLTDLLAREPDHPGAAHALHMPSHIFTHLGLWHDSIDSNLASAEAAAKATKAGKDNESGYQLHAAKYLEYAYLQLGRDSDARTVVEGVKDIPGIARVDIINDGNMMRAFYIMDTHQWETATQLTVEPDAVPLARIRTHWARAIAEVHLGNIEEARRDLEELRRALKGREGPNAEELEAEALLLYMQGKRDDAAEKMRAAVMSDHFSVDEVGFPACELLGDLMSELVGTKGAPSGSS